MTSPDLEEHVAWVFVLLSVVPFRSPNDDSSSLLGSHFTESRGPDQTPKVRGKLHPRCQELMGTRSSLPARPPGRRILGPAPLPGGLRPFLLMAICSPAPRVSAGRLSGPDDSPPGKPPPPRPQRRSCLLTCLPSQLRGRVGETCPFPARADAEV